MISQKDRLLFKKKIVSARSFLMKNNSFFALLLMHMRYVAVPGMEQMSTNGETIFFSPELMKKYSQNEVCSLLCHQVLHILMGDIWRPLASKGDEFHYKRDIIVNAELKACGVGTNYVYVRSIPDKEKYDEWDDVINRKTHRRMVDTDEFWGYELYDVEGGVAILEPTDDIWAQYWGYASSKSSFDSTSSQKRKGKTGENKQRQKDEKGRGSSGRQFSQLKTLWNKLAQQYAKQNDVPLSVKRSFMKNNNGHLDWRKLLADFIQEETFDYSFCPPDKRSEDIGFFLPDYSDKDFVVQDILFMVDTSGSISEEDLNEAYAEIQHAIDVFNGNLMGWLGFFDADITEPLPFGSANDVAKIVPYGGGGTDFRPIFDFMAQRYLGKLPACLIVYTDGFGEFPSESATLGVPVLWLINNNEVTPPFGKVARICAENFASGELHALGDR